MTSVTLVHPAKAVGRNEMPFGSDCTHDTWSQVTLDRGPKQYPHEKGRFGVGTRSWQRCRLTPIIAKLYTLPVCCCCCYYYYYYSLIFFTYLVDHPLWGLATDVDYSFMWCLQVFLTSTVLFNVRFRPTLQGNIHLGLIYTIYTPYKLRLMKNNTMCMQCGRYCCKNFSLKISSDYGNNDEKLQGVTFWDTRAVFLW